METVCFRFAIALGLCAGFAVAHRVAAQGGGGEEYREPLRVERDRAREYLGQVTR